MNLSLNSRIKLNNSFAIPLLDFGTYRLTGEKSVMESVTTAMQVGYRLIDTAQMYGNEQYMGNAVRESGIPREEIFITTRLDSNQHGYNKEPRSFDRCMERPKLQYMDLFLIH